jgi:two-component sensor histidine kinase
MKQLFSQRRFLEMSIHIVSWLLVFGFPLVFMDRGSGFNLAQFLRHSCVPLCYFIIFYVNYLCLVPRYMFTDEMRKYILSNAVLILCLSVLLHVFLESISTPPPPEFARHIPPRWIFYARDMGMMIFVAGLGAAIRTSLRWRQAEERLIEAERQKRDERRKKLRNQLNPHFLLNTLNNIYALIAFDSDKAQAAVQELSRLLRHVLYDNQQNFVSLGKEMDFIRNYIELMRIRLSANVQMITKFDIQPDSQTLIAPLIFISLIENAFKHGISPTESSFISIHLSENDKEVICEIRNSNHPKTVEDKSGSGVGLEQVSRRLEILYPGAYTWSKGISKDEKVYESKLSIKIRE